MLWAIGDIKDDDLIAEVDDITVSQANRLKNSVAIEQRAIGAAQILQVPATVGEPEARVTTRNGTTRDHQAVAICTPDGRHILVEAIRAPRHHPLLDGETGQHRATTGAQVAISACALVRVISATGRTVQ